MSEQHSGVPALCVGCLSCHNAGRSLGGGVCVWVCGWLVCVVCGQWWPPLLIGRTYDYVRQVRGGLLSSKCPSHR